MTQRPGDVVEALNEGTRFAVEFGRKSATVVAIKSR
jgi:hypothetical protein